VTDRHGNVCLIGREANNSKEATNSGGTMYIGGKQATRTENYTMCFATGRGKYIIYYVNGIPPLGLYFALFWYMANFLAATKWMLEVLPRNAKGNQMGQKLGR